MRGGWIVALVLLAAPPAAASMMTFGLGKPAGNGYTPLCGGANPVCAYAHSTERQMVAGATVALQVYRSVDGTTQDVGFTSAGRVNTATVDGFCNASVGGVISRNCLLSKVYDQSGNNCPIYNSTAGNMPDYLVGPTHQGLPRFQKVYQGAGGILTFLLDSNGGVASFPSHQCTALGGGPQGLFFAGNSSYGAYSSGQDGATEGTIGARAGNMYSAFTGFTTLVQDLCITGAGHPCGGVDTEGQGPQANFTRTANDDYIDITTTAGGTGPFNTWVNNAQITTNESVPTALTTPVRMTWGDAGDHTTPGPNIARSEAFFLVNLTSGQVASLYSNETTFTAGLTTTYQGPGDIIGGETSYSSGLTNGQALQLQWLEQCSSLRKCYAAYEGPALNACQGQGAVSCEDIGWVNNTIDTATLSAFCGPVSGLNNCTVQTWYNQALSWLSGTNGVTTTIDATAVSSSNRPAVLWSGCGTTTITVCIQTSPTNYFTTNPAGGTFSGGYSMSAVAMRTGGTTSLSAILASAATPVTLIGFAASANTCAGQAGASAASTAACNDNVVHSITVDAHTSPSTSTITYADGTAGASSASTISYGTTGFGVGATGAGADPCTCQLSEIMTFGDSHNSAFNAALGSAGVASLRANQRATFGF